MNIDMIAEKIAQILGQEYVTQKLVDRYLYARDLMSGGLVDDKAEKKPHLPDIIASPSTTKEVSAVLKIASEYKIPVVPFGAGSGVSGGTIPLHGGIMLDLKRMNRILSIEQKDDHFILTAESGILGMHLEQKLNLQGYTLGHFPSSILCSTLGGGIACRGAGQLSSKYGKIEDMVLDVEVVLASGEILPFGKKHPKYPNVHPKDLFVGTEGCLGIITTSKLRILPLPQTTRYTGVLFPKIEDALKSMREMLQEGLRPSVMRLYDPLDTILLEHGYKKKSSHENDTTAESLQTSWLGLLKQILPLPKEVIKKKAHQWLFEHPEWVQKLVEKFSSKVILILAFEGTTELSEVFEKSALAISQKNQGQLLGETPGLHWLKHRYSVSYKMPQVFEQDSIVDTIEVATSWSNLLNLYHTMRKKLTQKVLLLAHYSHAYPEGCSIYFTFLTRTGSPEKDRLRYQEVWNEAMEACLKAGGTISHHHGIGLLKAKYLPRELGAGAKELGGGFSFFQKMKKTLDPHNLLNPGKMGL